MSNVAASFDKAEAQKDEGGDDLHLPHDGEKVSCDDSLPCGENSSRKKARHNGPGDNLSKNGHPNSSAINGMHKGHVDGSHGAQHDDLIINAAVADVLENAEIGQRFGRVDIPSHGYVSATHTDGQRLPSEMPFHKDILDENEYGSIPVGDISGTPTKAADGTSSKQLSESALAFDGTAAHEVPYNGTTDHTSEDCALDGHGDILESPTGCVAGPISLSAPMNVGKPPNRVVPTNYIIGRYTQEKAFPFFGFSDLSAVQDKGEPAQFSLHETFGNHDNRQIATNYRFSNNAAATAHEESFTNNQPGGEDLKVNLEHITFGNLAENLTTKDGSIFSASSYYASQPGYMKNLALVLRFGSAIFSLIAFSVIISNSEKRVAAGSTFYVKFSDYQAYNYLAALNLLTFLYSSGQLILVAQGRTGRILASPIKWGASLYLCDQMLAFLMMSSSSSAATASQMSHHGLHNIWPPACTTWKLSLFCSRADVAVAMSFVSCLFMFLSTFSSGYHLSNLLAE